MSEVSKTFNILINSDAKLDALRQSEKEISGLAREMKVVGVDVAGLEKELADLDKQLSSRKIELYTDHLKEQIVETKAAGGETAVLETRLAGLIGAMQATGTASHEAGVAHGHSAQEMQALRQAATSDKEGGWALQALMRGDYVTAMHEAKFATIGLTSAVKANPMAWVIFGVSAAITAIELFIHKSDEGKEHTENLGNAAKTAGDQFDSMGNKVEDAGEKLTTLESKKQAVEHITDVLKRAADEATRLRKASDELGSAKLQFDLSAVNLKEAQGDLTPDQANNKRSALRLGEESRKVDADFEETHAGVRRASDVTEEKENALKKARENGEGTAARRDTAVQEAGALGLPTGARSAAEFGKAIQAQTELVKAREEQLADLPYSLNGSNPLVIENVKAALAREFKKLLALKELAQARQEAAAAWAHLEQADKEANKARATQAEVERDAREKLPVIALRRETLRLDSNTENTKAEFADKIAQTKERREKERAEREVQRQQIKRELESMPQTSEEALAGQRELAKGGDNLSANALRFRDRETRQRQLARLNYDDVDIEDPAAQQRKQDEIREEERLRREKVQAPELGAAQGVAAIAGRHPAIAEEALRAARDVLKPGGDDSSTVTALAAAIHRLVDQANSGLSTKEREQLKELEQKVNTALSQNKHGRG